MKNKILSGLSWNFGNRIIANSVQVLVYFILARILRPEDFGTVAIVMIVINLGKILSTSGLGASIIQEKDFSKKKYIVLQTLSLSIGVIGMLFLILISPTLSEYFQNFAQLEELLILASPIILLSSIYAIQSSMLIRDLNFKSLFYISVIPSIIAGTVSIFLAHEGYGGSAIIWNSLISTGISVLILSWKFKEYNRLDFEFRSIQKSIQFSVNVLLINLLEEAYRALYTFFIGKKFGDKELGFYNFGRQLPGYASLTVNATLSTILFPALSKQSSTEKRITYNKAFTYSILFYAPLIGLTFLLAEDVMFLFFKEKWKGSLPFVYIFALIYSIHNLHYNYTQFLYSSGESRKALNFEIVKKIIAITVFVYTMNESLIFIAFGQLFVSIIIVLYTLIITLSKHAMPSKKYLYKVFKILSFNIIIFIVLKIILGSFQEVFLKILFGLLAYFLVAIWLLKYFKVFNSSK